MKIKVGLVFTGKWLKSRIEVRSINDNNLGVLLTMNNTTWGEIWNLQHTKWGFEMGHYFLYPKDNNFLSINGREVKLTDRQYAMLADAIALGIEEIGEQVPGHKEGCYTLEETLELQKLLPKHVNQDKVKSR